MRAAGAAARFARAAAARVAGPFSTSHEAFAFESFMVFETGPAAFPNVPLPSPFRRAAIHLSVVAGEMIVCPPPEHGLVLERANIVLHNDIASPMAVYVGMKIYSSTPAPGMPPSRDPAPHWSPPGPEYWTPPVVESPTPAPAPHMPSIADAEAPCHRRPVPYGPDPGIIVIAGAVYDSSINADERSVVAGSISDIHYFWG
jgi:hypothetical protein